MLGGKRAVSGKMIRLIEGDGGLMQLCIHFQNNGEDAIEGAGK